MRTVRFLQCFAWVGLFLSLSSVVAFAQPATTLATGLQAPIKIRLTPVGNLLVAEGGTGPNTGRISLVSRTGVRRTLVDGLPSGINRDGASPAPIGPTGLEYVADTLYVTIGSGDQSIPGPSQGTVIANPNASSPILSSVLRLRLGSVDSSAGNFHLSPAQHATIKTGGEAVLQNEQGETLRISLVVDFPDIVSIPGSDVAIFSSNPFGVVAFGSHIYVVDSNLNRIQNVDPVTGSFTTLTAFSQIINPLAPMGPTFIDAVPDSIRVSGGQFLVPMLTGFPFPPGAAFVSRVDPSTGSPQTLISGRTTAIDVLAPDTAPTKYFVLEFSTNMLAGAPGRLLFFDSATAAPTVVAAPLITPTNMALDPLTREIFVTEFGPGRIARVSVASVLAAASCTSDATTLCLGGGRYQVRAAFRTPQGVTGNGVAVSLTGTTGYFWFFSPDNAEVFVKVLDGCPVNSRKWVFASGMTNVNVTLTVTDTVTGATRAYENPINTPFAPIQDTAAFTCPVVM
ncbi:MAG: ScyD/ScyE family protein [Acidobacteriota bacterium]